jgi:hypothetical protein
MTTYKTDFTTPAFDDWQAERLAAWTAEHPVTLTDWEQRIHDLSAEVEAPEVDEDTQRGDMANAEAARVYGGRDV